METFVPQYEGPIQGYVHNTLRKNFWRVKRHREYEDLIQDSHVVFLKLKQKYEGTVDNPAWFMALYTRSFSNYITNLSIKDSLNSVELSESYWVDEDEDLMSSVIANAMGIPENEGYYKLLLSKAAPEVRSVINILLNCPTEILELVQRSLGNRKDVAGNEALCRMIGKDPTKWDLVQMVRETLSPA